MFAGAFARAETRHHGDQRDENEGENDHEFDHGENALNAVMPRRPERVRLEGTISNYGRFTLHNHGRCQVDRKLAIGL